jgi:hypothetical protein
MVEGARQALLIKRHDVNDVVELSDGSEWRIWPGDISTTLSWLPDTAIEISGTDDEICSHVLISRSDQSQRVRVIKASAHWPAEKVRRSLGEADNQRDCRRFDSALLPSNQRRERYDRPGWWAVATEYSLCATTAYTVFGLGLRNVKARECDIVDSVRAHRP